MDSCKTPETYEHGSPSRKRSEPTTTVTDVHLKKNRTQIPQTTFFFLAHKSHKSNSKSAKKKHQRRPRNPPCHLRFVYAPEFPHEFHEVFPRRDLRSRLKVERDAPDHGTGVRTETPTSDLTGAFDSSRSSPLISRVFRQAIPSVIAI